MFKPVAGIVMLCLLFSCNSTEQPGGLYPIDSLLTAQVQYLPSIQARLQKKTMLLDKTDSILFTPADTAAWARELDIFRQLNIINKPINRDSYQVTEANPDSASNLLVKSIASIADVPVKFLNIYYQDSLSKPRQIEARYDESNSLYESVRLLRLEFSQVNNKTILTSYSINGGQKMLMADSVSFSIEGKIFIE